MSKVFFVYCPDFTDEGAPERRNKVRAQHLEAAKAHAGPMLVGGPMVDETGKMTGSTKFVYAESAEEVRKELESDIYFRAGVWDPEKIAIWPYRPAGPPKL
ncbi:hypothetical protein CALCODRAFT_484663 [Calocera cornea HHB12733]|uniref:YCII-related domain-containing protein n=1 Tax=Calocera cornea HHB12733 TaxID=1353952 RepID=A0A165EUV5_9BASI|nr:hypothetical protein CALCODRAFT_484663 [Calocera cornea HHB12733]